MTSIVSYLDCPGCTGLLENFVEVKLLEFRIILYEPNQYTYFGMFHQQNTASLYTIYQSIPSLHYMFVKLDIANEIRQKSFSQTTKLWAPQMPNTC